MLEVEGPGLLEDMPWPGGGCTDETLCVRSELLTV